MTNQRWRFIPLLSRAIVGGIDSGMRMENGKSCWQYVAILSLENTSGHKIELTEVNKLYSSEVLHRLTGLGPTKS